MRRHLEAHDLPRVGEVVDAAVENAVVRPLVLLEVDHARQVRATRRGEEAAHLDRHLDHVRKLAYCRRDLARRGEIIAEVIVVEVRHGKARAVFEALHLEAVLDLELADELA